MGLKLKNKKMKMEISNKNLFDTKKFDKPKILKKISQPKTKDKSQNKIIKEIKNDLISLEDAKKIVNPRFIVDEPLEKGGFGSVFLAHLKDNPNKKVAIKIIKEKNINKGMFNSEIIIHNKLRNKYICEIYGYNRVNEYNCLIIEYFKYGDIENFKRNIVQRSVLSESFLCFLAYSILNALKYLNLQQKIIHLDIKPQNILINEYLMIKLTDFSISLNYKNKNQEDIINLPSAGTCYYMSPEILDKNKRKIKVKDASKIDIYSLGVTLYVLAYCDYPYNLKNIDQKDYEGILKSIKNNELIFNEEEKYSEGFKNLLKRMLNKDINERYNVIEALNDPWVKSCSFLLDEKEKLFNCGKFLVELLVDGIKEFNEYVGIKLR